jgi:hypothetical protein
MRWIFVIKPSRVRLALLLYCADVIRIRL